MFKANIVENKVYCPRCEQSNYQLTSNYGLVEIEGTRYIEFIARCLTENCNEKFYFQTDIGVNKHFNFSRDKEIEIKDEFVERG